VKECPKRYTDPSSLRKHICNDHGKGAWAIAQDNKKRSGRGGSYGLIELRAGVTEAKPLSIDAWVVSDDGTKGMGERVGDGDKGQGGDGPDGDLGESSGSSPSGGDGVKMEEGGSDEEIDVGGRSNPSPDSTTQEDGKAPKGSGGAGGVSVEPKPCHAVSPTSHRATDTPSSTTIVSNNNSSGNHVMPAAMAGSGPVQSPHPSGGIGQTQVIGEWTWAVIGDH